jgi:glucose-1-phosphate cytidylyltransferase
MRGGVDDLPKPMVNLGSRPILWHLMKYYAHWGYNDFILCLGYKGGTIKRFFATYEEWISNDFVVSGGSRGIELLKRDMDDWRITLIDTGLDTSIGERLMKVRPLLEKEPVFLANYSDALSDFPMPAVVDHLEKTAAIGSMLVVRPNISLHFINKEPNGIVTDVLDAQQASYWINAGFFAFRPEIFDYMKPGEDLVIKPFERLIRLRKLAALEYNGFWRCCDTFKDYQVLENLQARGPAPWELWRRHTLGEGSQPTPAAANGHDAVSQAPQAATKVPDSGSKQVGGGPCVF